MKELSVYVWWSAGRGDGDGYDTTIELSDEAYSAVTLSGTQELDEVGNNEAQQAYEALINGLIEESEEYDEYYQEEYCQEDDDDEDYDDEDSDDEDCEDEEYDDEPEFENYREYFNSTYSCGVRLPDDLQPFFVAKTLTYPVTYCLGRGDGRDGKVKMFTEIEEINKLIECCREEAEIEDCQELKELVNKIREEVYNQQGEILTEDELDNMSIRIDFPKEICMAVEMMMAN